LLRFPGLKGQDIPGQGEALDMGKKEIFPSPDRAEYNFIRDFVIVLYCNPLLPFYRRQIYLIPKHEEQHTDDADGADLRGSG
jgi:hypothetical protein